ncbi:NACHT domain-containing protein [Trichocoleus sp. ST-U3]
MAEKGGYKPGWQELHKGNLLKLLEVLLSLAEEQLELGESHPPQPVEARWISQTKLLVTGRRKERRGKTEKLITGTSREDLVQQVTKYDESLKPVERRSSEQENQKIRNVFACLDELGLFKVINDSPENAKYKEFTLEFESRYKEKEDNLKWVEKKWNAHPKTKSPQTSPEVTSAKDEDINWREICQTMLECQKRLTTNQLMSDEDMKFEIDDVYVELGLVERKKQPKVAGVDFAEQGSRLYEPEYEEKARFEHQRFLQDVLKGGKGNSKGKRIAIVGEPGAGKSTLLRKIAFWVLENTSDLPILITLADLAETNPQQEFLEQYLLGKWLKAALPFISPDAVEVTEALKTELKRLCNQGRVRLLLDGVDEMPLLQEEPLLAIQNQLNGWVGQMPAVLSCRLNVWDANRNVLADNFEIYRTLEFSYGDGKTPDQVGEFIAKRFKREPELGEQLRRALDEPGKERIKDLVKNPLRLTLLCRTWSLWREHGGLPDTKAKLYKGFVEKFYEWKGKEFPTTSSQQMQLNQALGELAKLAIDQTASRFRLKHSLVCQVLGQPDQPLYRLAVTQLSWLTNVGLAAENPDETVYAFFHPTFQEYFAAYAIPDWDFFLPREHEDKPVEDKDNPGKYKPYRIFDPQWKEVILLWLGREDVEREQKEEFIKVLLEFEDNCLKPYWGFYQYRAYFLAAAGMTEFESCSRVDEIVRQIVEWAFGFFDIDKQAWMYRGFYPIHKYARAVLWETNRSHVIVVISEWLCLCQEERIRKKVTENNGKQTEEENIKQLALTLLKFSPSNLQATQAINNLVNSSQNDLFKYLKSVKLEFNQLVAYLSDDRQEKTETTDTLEKAIPKNIDEIAMLIDLLHSSENDANVFCETISKLDKIITGNLSALPVVVNIIKQSLMEDEEADYYPLFIALECLPKIGAGSLEAISVLKEVLQRNLDYRHYAIKFKAVLALIAIGVGSQDAFNILIKIVHQREKRLYRQTALSLQNILQGDLFRQAVVNLKGYLNNSIYENDRGFYIHCYWTLLYCTQNMTYVDFYQAWRNPISTHLESQETTAVASNSSTQSFDLANLPQLLNTAIANNSSLNDTIHLICIDSSKFENPDNPASEIYAEMVMQGCPERHNGEPETMQALKVYCQLKCQGAFLIFYEDTSDELPQGFSKTFLTSLSKFFNARRICVVSEQPCNLQTFSPSQPNLIADIVNWIKEKMMEE